MNFFGRSGQPLIHFQPRMHQLYVVERVVHHTFEQSLGNVRGKIGEDRAIVARLFERAVGQRQYTDVRNAKLGVVFLHHFFQGYQNDPLDRGALRLRILE